jgi:hypothetical protein
MLLPVRLYQGDRRLSLLWPDGEAEEGDNAVDV